MAMRLAKWMKSAGAALTLVMASGAIAYADRVEFIVPSAVIYPGQTIEGKGLFGKPFTIKREFASQYAVNADQVIGKIARRTLLPGKPILVSAVNEPHLVQRGVPAMLVFNAGGLEILTTGTPLEPGGIGDFIKVRNVDSGITVSGTVLADGRIRVGMQ
ncbi:MAG: flagellar basal body P-ring formation chaperone FlgA [Phyllobacterium sp.]